MFWFLMLLIAANILGLVVELRDRDWIGIAIFGFGLIWAVGGLLYSLNVN